MFFEVIGIMIGGAIGAVSRHFLFTVVQRAAAVEFPMGTLFVNLAGSFLIGMFWNMFDTIRINPTFRLFLFTGFLGGFTTFSTFAREATQLFKVGQWKSALLYLGLSDVLGVLCVLAGFAAAGLLLHHGRA